MSGHGNGHPNGKANGHARPVNRIAAIPFEDRLPPHNVEAEEGVLGAILLEGRAVLDAIDPPLRPGDFYRDDHQLVYRAMLVLAGAGKPIDTILVEEELARRGELPRIGGLETLGALVAKVAHSANAAHHAAIVRDKAIARELIEGARVTMELGYSNTITAADLAERARRHTESNAHRVDPAAADVAEDGVPRRRGGAARRLGLARTVPSGMLSGLMGDPELGKSFITTGIAATISLGTAWPDLPGSPTEAGSVVFLSAEDSLAHMIKPRLEAAGADCRKVHALTMVGAGTAASDPSPSPTTYPSSTRCSRRSATSAWSSSTPSMRTSERSMATRTRTSGASSAHSRRWPSATPRACSWSCT